jgi:hypothetical protein
VTVGITLKMILAKADCCIENIMLSVIMPSVVAPYQQQNHWFGNPIKRSADHENETLSITFKSDA